MPRDIVIADDHALMRQGLCKILEEQPDWQVVGQAGTGREAVQLVLERAPSIAIIDVTMPLLSGIEAASQITRRLPQVRILMLSMHAEEAYIMQALRAGASGYLLKDSADVELIAAVNALAAGKSYFSPAVARVMLDDHLRQLASKGIVDRYELLSEREREVFQLIAEGYNNKETARTLSISPTTIETHRAHIFQKLGLHNAAELVLFAIRRGLIC
jgi:two-component system, NarL family, response regulator NreC